jgi:hypothetical protein
MLPKKSFLNQENNFSKMPESSDSRTLHLDRDIITSLTSSDFEEVAFAVESLPEAMTIDEINDLGLSINFRAGIHEINDGKKLETSTLISIGMIALSLKEDIVTAESTTKHLRKQGLNGIIASFLLGKEVRKAKKAVVSQIIAE